MTALGRKPASPGRQLPDPSSPLPLPLPRFGSPIPPPLRPSRSLYGGELLRARSICTAPVAASEGASYTYTLHAHAHGPRGPASPGRARRPHVWTIMCRRFMYLQKRGSAEKTRYSTLYAQGTSAAQTSGLRVACYDVRLYEYRVPCREVSGQLHHTGPRAYSY